MDEEELRKQREEVTAIVKMRVAGTASGTQVKDRALGGDSRHPGLPQPLLDLHWGLDCSQHAGDFICTVYLEEKKAEAEQHIKVGWEKWTCPNPYDFWMEPNAASIWSGTWTRPLTSLTQHHQGLLGDMHGSLDSRDPAGVGNVQVLNHTGSLWLDLLKRVRIFPSLHFLQIPASMTAEELTLEILDRRNVCVREKDYWVCFEVNEREETGG